MDFDFEGIWKMAPLSLIETQMIRLSIDMSKIEMVKRVFLKISCDFDK